MVLFRQRARLSSSAGPPPVSYATPLKASLRGLADAVLPMAVVVISPTAAARRRNWARLIALMTSSVRGYAAEFVVPRSLDA
jgi:hypothetical protein